MISKTHHLGMHGPHVPGASDPCRRYYLFPEQARRWHLFTFLIIQSGLPLPLVHNSLGLSLSGFVFSGLNKAARAGVKWPYSFWTRLSLFFCLSDFREHLQRVRWQRYYGHEWGGDVVTQPPHQSRDGRGRGIPDGHGFHFKVSQSFFLFGSLDLCDWFSYWYNHLWSWAP